MTATQRLRGLLSARVARFVIVGVGSAALLAVVTYLLIQAGVSPFASGLIAYAVAFGVAYALQRNWTFEGAGRHSRTLPRYFLVQAACALISGGLTHALKSWLGWPAAGASLAMTFVVAVISYLASTYWVFADAQDAE